MLKNGWETKGEQFDHWLVKSVCRDERCTKSGIHAPHKLRGSSAEARSTKKNFAGKSPWQMSAKKALTNAIAKATSITYPTHFKKLLDDVENDYGVCCDRQVYRALKILVERKQIIKMDLGGNLFAYVRPGSKLVNDPGLVREQIMGAIDLVNIPWSARRPRKSNVVGVVSEATEESLRVVEVQTVEVEATQVVIEVVESTVAEPIKFERAIETAETNSYMAGSYMAGHEQEQVTSIAA